MICHIHKKYDASSCNVIKTKPWDSQQKSAAVFTAALFLIKFTAVMSLQEAGRVLKNLM